ncbi:MAG: hypothetical protein M3347_09760 [Armatimonadota bacterium]|nr:hypothetical protein [Armatimonadota bacterium]
MIYRVMIALTGTALLLILSFGCGSSRSSGPVFDIPALLDKKIAQVEAALGPPAANATTPAVPATTATGVELARKTFQKDGQTLVVTYAKHNGEVAKFEISSDSRMLKEEKKKDFLRIGNLKEDDPRYTVNYVEATDKPFYYTGVEVLVKPVEHQVKLRVIGSSDLVMVNYELRPPGGEVKAEKDLLTLPPWEVSASAVSGTQVSISGVLFGRPRTRSPKFTLQILLDGKVVKESASTGMTTQCSLLL